MAITMIPAIGDSRFKRWAKVLTKVDRTKRGGYMYEGDFVTVGRKYDLEPGILLLQYGEEGSRRHATPVVAVARLQDDGAWLELVTSEGADWALDIREDVIIALAGSEVQA